MQSCRHRTLLFTIALFVMSGCATLHPNPGATIEDNSVSFESVDTVINEMSAKYGADDVLVVLDIDNTIMTSGVDLGGDVWYQWQRGKLDVKPTDDQKVACLFEDAIGLLYELGPMRLTEDSLPSRVRAWQDAGNTVFALTSRSPTYRAATERELERLGIDLTRAPLTAEGEAAPVLREMADREWSYMQGIMMTTGMNKATMLKTLLDRTGRDFSAIVFVDDTRRHIDDVFAAYQESDQAEVRVFHYTKIEAEREHALGSVLTQEQADRMDADWDRLNALLNDIFPSRVLSSGCLGN